MNAPNASLQRSPAILAGCLALLLGGCVAGTGNATVAEVDRAGYVREVMDNPNPNRFEVAPISVAEVCSRVGYWVANFPSPRMVALLESGTGADWAGQFDRECRAAANSASHEIARIGFEGDPTRLGGKFLISASKAGSERAFIQIDHTLGPGDPDLAAAEHNLRLIAWHLRTGKVVPGLLKPSAGAAAVRTRAIGRSAPQFESLILEDVIVTANATVLRFVLRGREKGRVHRPGTRNAFYLLGHATGRRYAIRDARGISWAPLWTYVPAAGRMEFELEFERLDEADTVFDLVEGEERFEPGGYSWSIPAIELD